MCNTSLKNAEEKDSDGDITEDNITGNCNTVEVDNSSSDEEQVRLAIAQCVHVVTNSLPFNLSSCDPFTFHS